MNLGEGRNSIAPRLATSVAISKNTWLWTSRLGGSEPFSSLAMFLFIPQSRVVMERRRKDGGTRKVMLESLRSGPREAGREMFQLHRQQLDGSSSYNNNAAVMIITREMRGGERVANAGGWGSDALTRDEAPWCMYYLAEKPLTPQVQQRPVHHGRTISIMDMTMATSSCRPNHGISECVSQTLVLLAGS